MLRVQHHVLVQVAARRSPALQPPLVEHRRELLRLFNRHGADEDGPALCVLVDDLGDDGLPFFGLGPVHEIGILDARQLAIRGNDDYVQVVDLGEFFRLGVGRAGHAREFLVFAEVVLEGHGGERLVLALDLDLRVPRVVFLRFNGLMEAVAPAAPRHQAAGELVDDHDFAVLHHVIDVVVEQRMRTKRLVDVMLQVRVLEVVQVTAVQVTREHLLGLRHPALGEVHRLVLLVLDEVAGGFERFSIFGLGVAARHRAGLELGDDAIDLVIEVRRQLRRPRDDERRPRLVDQDAVDLVHDREMMAALHVVRELELHVVAQVVEPEFVIRAVGDVAGVCHLAFGVGEIVLDDADRHAEEAIDLAHPLGVAAGEIVVHGDDVHALAVERVQIDGQRRDERLAFARLHLGDLSLVENRAADELHVEMAHPEHPSPRFADDGKRLGHEVVDRLALGEPFAEFDGLGPEALVRKSLDVGLEHVDFAHDRTQALQFAFVRGTDDLGEKCLDHLQRGMEPGYQTIVADRRRY